MGRVRDPIPEVPSAELGYPSASTARPNDPLGLGIVATNDSGSPVMPILIAGVSGFAIVSFVMLVALVLRSRTLIARRNLRAMRAAAPVDDADTAPDRHRRGRTPKPMHVPVPIVVVEPDASVEIAFRLAQGPNRNGEAPQRTTFPGGVLPMLRTPTVAQLAGLSMSENVEPQKKSEEAVPGGS